MTLDLFGMAMAAGLIIAAVTAPLGCFVVWRRMAYFGDAIAHSALLGVLIGIYFDLHLNLAIVPVALAFALLLNWLQKHTHFSTDTLLGIVAHIALASGVLAVALTPDLQVDLMAYLFGDILAVSPDDLIPMYIYAAVTLFVLKICWRPFVLMTLQEDVARVRGIDVDRFRLILMAMVAVTVAIAIKLVGLLLITSMLVIPAATARFMARSPVQMAWLAFLVAAIAVSVGLKAAWVIDAPAGPAVALTLGIFFLLVYVAMRLKTVFLSHAQSLKRRT
jgi:zinc transport system permease protein